MLKLFKYEMRKTLMAKLIMLGLTICLEAFFLITLSSKNIETCSLSIVLLFLAAVLGVVFIGIQSIVTLHHDMNTKQSYMLFMTPHTNYAILGAKALECTVSVMIASLFFYGLGVLDIRIIEGKFQDIDMLLQNLRFMLKAMGQDLLLDPTMIAAFVTDMLASWILVVMIAFLADVIATSLLKGKKFSGLLSFVFFVAINYVINLLIKAIVPGEHITVDSQFLSAAISLVIAAAAYVGTATLMEKKLSV